ncbi:hypothetical protein PHLGIDRAFT_126562 [Phlebiopsis gigantea 11061_1 CR5-6]|uniref:Nucleolus and neural progenitor protein-like N-terminal domain-containing protein n=1 Tax=Phlebiopsis gigantea (strain 11061_1 CR5-6) TaxID=745531 RepID=A0A0C3SCT9_PHLG1|nr:hypothetical protein PHLGIDRAFT_126562 [Phlebiopsis gigantea 11061_1 CR5-6]
MTAPRRVDIPLPICSPRNTLNIAKQGSIDSILKDLKACTRKLQVAFASHHVELQVLEKLYYKGSNQHRSALFWRRIADVRRHARRLEEVKIHEQVDALRFSFWGDIAERNAKILKGPWTHLPDVPSVLRLLERLRSCLVFITSMEEHLTKAHNHLNLDLQTGAFLQYILVLTAITSRIAILLTEIGPAVASAWTIYFRLLVTLDPKHLAGRYKGLDPRNTSTPEMSSRPSANLQTVQDMDEDLGSAVLATASRSAVTVAERTTVAVPAQDREETVVSEDLGFIFSQPAAASSTAAVIRATVQRVSTKARESEAVPRKRIKSSSSTVQDNSLKKKRKKKDEIDDIFGF